MYGNLESRLRMGHRVADHHAAFGAASADGDLDAFSGEMRGAIVELGNGDHLLLTLVEPDSRGGVRPAVGRGEMQARALRDTISFGETRHPPARVPLRLRLR